jgi:hypothetical protein
MEIWKDIQNYEGLYQVSNLGSIRSSKNGKTRKEKLLKPFYSNNYPRVHLYKNGKRKKKLVHRLVAVAFLGNPLSDELVVNHKNKDTKDATVSNLEWVTVSENNLHSFHGTFCQKTIGITKIQGIMKLHGITKEDL